LQLTHSPSTRIPSTTRFRRPFRPPVVPPPPPGTDDATPYPVSRALASRQPLTPTLFLHLLLVSRRCSARRISRRLSAKLSILSGATFTTPTPTFFASLHRYIACRADVRRYHIVHPRSTHIPHPSPGKPMFPPRETTAGRTSWFFTGQGGGGGEARLTVHTCIYIVVIFFMRFQAHRSSTTRTRPGHASTRRDAPTRSLSPRFSPS